MPRADRFQALYEHAPFGIMMIDKQGGFRYLNPKFKELFGYDLDDIPDGKTWFRKAYPDPAYRRSVISTWLEDLRTSGVEEKRPRIFSAICKNGTTKIINFISVQLETGENLVTCEDITDRKRTEETAKQMAQENSIVAEIGRIISSTLNVDEVYERFAAEVREIIPFDRIAINITDPDHLTTVIAYTSGVEVGGRRQGDVIPTTGTLTEEVIRTRSGVIVQGENQDEIVARFPNLLPTLLCGIRSFMTVPLISKDQTIGTLHFRSKEPNPYSEKDLRLAERVGNQIAGAISNSLLFRELKRTEEALRESHETLTTVLDSLEADIYIADLDTYEILFVNRHMRDSFGQDLVGKICYRFFRNETAPCAICTNSKLLDAERKPTGVILWEGQNPLTGRWYMNYDRAIRWKNVRLAWLQIAIDITERRRIEETIHKGERFLASIFASIQDGLTILDMDLSIVRVNPVMESWYSHAMPLAGKKCYEAYHGRSEPCEICPTLQTIQTEKVAYEIVPKIGPRGETTGWFDLYSFPLLDMATGKMEGVIEYVRDITKRKQTEDEKKALEEQFRQSQKMEAIGRLAGGIAHDFNNLLTVIQGYTQLSLAEAKEGDPLRGNIVEIHKASDRAADLTRRLLAFSRRQIMEMRPVDLNVILRDLDRMLRRILGEDIELVTPLSAPLGRIKSDSGQIEQVILNLAVNARDAMPNGGKLIMKTTNVDLDESNPRGQVNPSTPRPEGLGLLRVDPERGLSGPPSKAGLGAVERVNMMPGPYVMLSITDTGCGMSTEVKEHLFEPFFTTKEKGKGTGLGLSTVYGIVKQSGGEILVLSEVGRGTTFEIYFPRMEGAAQDFLRRTRESSFPQGRETVLLVEDESPVRDLAHRILDQQGYTVLEAGGGDEALRLAEAYAGEIHLLLTDVVMPGMNGRELAERLALLRPRMKVLYMSGYANDTIVHHGILDAGITFLQKPFSPAFLARKVRKVLEDSPDEA